MPLLRKVLSLLNFNETFIYCHYLAGPYYVRPSLVFFVNTLLYVAGLLGWLGFRPFDAPYTQRICIGWGQMMVLFIWPQSHLYGKINTKVRSSLCCPWWGQHLGHYSGPTCSLSRKLANCASRFG
jgi:hypothetical protein